MLNQLKRWFQASKGKRAAGRGRVSRSYGQIEKLEDRTVLSATFGELPGNLDFASLESSELAYAEAPHLAEAHFFDPAAPQAANFNGLDQGTNPIWPIGQQLKAPQYILVVIRVYAPSAPSTVEQPLRAQAPTPPNEPAMPPIPPPLAATSSLSMAPTNPQPQPQLATQSSLDLSGWILSPLASDVSARDLATSSTESVVESRDVAFQDYADEPTFRLTGDVQGKLSAADLPDEALELLGDENEEQALELRDFGLRDEVSVSLDVLDNELRAVDAVLSDLHSFTARDEAHQDDADYDSRLWSEIRESRDLKYLQQIDPVNVAKTTSDNLAEGGMVLLQLIDDANLNDMDLAHVIVEGFYEPVVVPRGAEFSVGMCQEFDVGSNALQSTSENAASPAPPAAAVGPGDSAGRSAGERSQENP